MFRAHSHALTALGVVASLAILSAPPPAAAQTWTGAALDGGNWNTANNWNPTTFPNSTVADAIFDTTGAGNVSIVSSVSTRSLTFTNAAGNYNITSSSATISNLTAITVAPDVATTQTINLVNVATGSLLFPNSSNLTIANNAAAAGTTLVIGPNTVFGTPGSGGIAVTGTGTTTISGSFATTASTNNQVLGGLMKSGPGRLIFSGNGSNLVGGLTLAGGALELNYVTNTASKLGGGNLNTTGGDLVLVTSGVITQNVAGTSLNAGHTDIMAPSGSNITIGLAGISRSPGATLSLSGSGVLNATTSTGNTNSLLGTGLAFATVGGNFWATASGGSIVALAAGPTNAFGGGNNTDVSGSFSRSSFTTNSLRFGAGGVSLTLNDANIVQSGGILVSSSNVNGALITGGILVPGTTEIIVHAFGDLTINSQIVSSGGLTKTGPATLTLGGDNSGLFGPTNINRGALAITTTAAVSGTSAINFNDNRSGGNGQQSLRVQLGDGVNGLISRPIQFAANSPAGSYANVISTGTSENSQITLSGIIGSAPGTVTPIRFTGTGTNTSGFNLIGTNTFTGDIDLNQGALGINSNASLGNAPNTLFLEANSTTAGGLEFLNGGIDLTRPVVISLVTRVLSNAGDVNTISGPVSGSLLFKDGTGTLVLSGINTQSGLMIAAGTVRVAADANLCSAGFPVAINSGATFAVIGTFANSRVISLGPLSGTLPGTSTIDVAAGQTLSLNGQVSGVYGALLKTGAGALVLGGANTYGGGTTVQQGALQVFSDGGLGTVGTPVAVSTAGTLTFAGSTFTSRTFNMNGGALSVTPGNTLTLNNASVFGGFLRGTGTYVLTGGTTLSGVTTFNSTIISVIGAASFTNFSSSGALSVAAGNAGPITFNGFINQGSGAITIGAGSAISAADFQTYGLLTLANGTGATKTLFTNTGTTPLYFNGGSRTFIGTAGGNGRAQIELNGQNAIVAGGLFVNNGQVTDSSAAGISTIIADYGTLVKGAGTYDNSPITQNGGKFQSGNSPGIATMGRFVFGPGGVSNYVFAIDDATGQAGPRPDALGHVSGWGLVTAAQWQRSVGMTSGDFAFTADASHPLSVAIDTLVNPTTVGTDVPGLMTDFDPTRSYSWPAVQWTGTYSGPTDVAALDSATTFDTSDFANPMNGAFGWSLDPAGQALSLTYTPSAVPEPGSLVLVGVAAAGLACWRRRGQPTSGRDSRLA